MLQLYRYHNDISLTADTLLMNNRKIVFDRFVDDVIIDPYVYVNDSLPLQTKFIIYIKDRGLNSFKKLNILWARYNNTINQKRIYLSDFIEYILTQLSQIDDSKYYTDDLNEIINIYNFMNILDDEGTIDFTDACNNSNWIIRESNYLKLKIKIICIKIFLKQLLDSFRNEIEEAFEFIKSELNYTSDKNLCKTLISNSINSNNLDVLLDDNNNSNNRLSILEVFKFINKEENVIKTAIHHYNSIIELNFSYWCFDEISDKKNLYWTEDHIVNTDIKRWINDLKYKLVQSRCKSLDLSCENIKYDMKLDSNNSRFNYYLKYQLFQCDINMLKDKLYNNNPSNKYSYIPYIPDVQISCYKRLLEGNDTCPGKKMEIINAFLWPDQLLFMNHSINCEKKVLLDDEHITSLRQLKTLYFSKTNTILDRGELTNNMDFIKFRLSFLFSSIKKHNRIDSNGALHQTPCFGEICHYPQVHEFDTVRPLNEYTIYLSLYRENIHPFVSQEHCAVLSYRVNISPFFLKDEQRRTRIDQSGKSWILNLIENKNMIYKPRWYSSNTSIRTPIVCPYILQLDIIQNNIDTSDYIQMIFKMIFSTYKRFNYEKPVSDISSAEDFMIVINLDDLFLSNIKEIDLISELKHWLDFAYIISNDYATVEKRYDYLYDAKKSFWMYSIVSANNDIIYNFKLKSKKHRYLIRPMPTLKEAWALFQRFNCGFFSNMVHSNQKNTKDISIRRYFSRIQLNKCISKIFDINGCNKYKDFISKNRSLHENVLAQNSDFIPIKFDDLDLFSYDYLSYLSLNEAGLNSTHCFQKMIEDKNKNIEMFRSEASILKIFFNSVLNCWNDYPQLMEELPPINCNQFNIPFNLWRLCDSKDKSLLSNEVVQNTLTDQTINNLYIKYDPLIRKIKRKSYLQIMSLISSRCTFGCSLLNTCNQHLDLMKLIDEHYWNGTEKSNNIFIDIQFHLWKILPQHKHTISMITIKEWFNHSRLKKYVDIDFIKQYIIAFSIPQSIWNLLFHIQKTDMLRSLKNDIAVYLGCTPQKICLHLKLIRCGNTEQFNNIIVWIINIIRQHWNYTSLNQIEISKLMGLDIINYITKKTPISKKIQYISDSVILSYRDDVELNEDVFRHVNSTYRKTVYDPDNERWMTCLAYYIMFWGYNNMQAFYSIAEFLQTTTLTATLFLPNFSLQFDRVRIDGQYKYLPSTEAYSLDSDSTYFEDLNNEKYKRI